MNAVTYASLYSEKARFVLIAAWLIMVLIITAILQGLKDAVAWLLLKLYELFIQHGPLRF